MSLAREFIALVVIAGLAFGIAFVVTKVVMG